LTDTDEEEEHLGSDHSEVSDDDSTAHSSTSRRHRRVMAPDYAQLTRLAQELIKKISHCHASRIALGSVLLQMNDRADSGKFLNLDSHEIFPSQAGAKRSADAVAPPPKRQRTGGGPVAEDGRPPLGKPKGGLVKPASNAANMSRKMGAVERRQRGIKQKGSPKLKIKTAASLNSLPLATPRTKRCSICRERGHQMRSCPAMLRHGTLLTPEQRDKLALNLPLVGGHPTFPAKASGGPFCSALPIDRDFRAMVIHHRVYVNGPPHQESPENYGFLITCLDRTCKTFKGYERKHFLTAPVASFLLSQKKQHAVSRLLSPDAVAGLSEEGEVETKTALLNAHDEARSDQNSLSNKPVRVT